MKDWQVKFYLVDMYHSYIIQAKNEFEAYMTDFQIELKNY